MRLSENSAGLLIVDVQEKLFPHVDRPCEIMERIHLLIKGVKLLQIPVVVTEQYPQGLGGTIKTIIELLDDTSKVGSKTSFSVMGDDTTKQLLTSTGRKQWIVAGIEAHVCVLQTVRDLIEQGNEVVVVNDAISSRSIYDFSTAIAEMRDLGARISSTETVLFELFRDAKHPQFKAFSALIK